MVLRAGVPKDEVCINGRFGYTSKHKPLKDGHARADGYIGDQRRLDSSFCVKFHPAAIGETSPKQHSYIA